MLRCLTGSWVYTPCTTCCIISLTNISIAASGALYRFEMDDMQHVQLLGEIRSFEEMGEGASRRLVAHFTDGTAFVDLVWFRGIKFVKNKLQVGKKYVVDFLLV